MHFGQPVRPAAIPVEKEELIMCYEYWRSQKTRSAEDAAKKRAQELIEKIRSATPASKARAPATPEKEKQTVPA